jgi:hypothetical protein
MSSAFPYLESLFYVPYFFKQIIFTNQIIHY